MIIIGNNSNFAQSLFPADTAGEQAVSGGLLALVKRLFGRDSCLARRHPNLAGWRFGLVSEHARNSQYDAVCDLGRNNTILPDGLFCVAGSGDKFHGQRGRSWDSPPGNIYLTAHFAPEKQIDGFGVAFPILAAVSVVETIDSIPGLRGKAGIKWVNDIFLNEKKVSGFLACNHNIQGAVSSVTIGIGLNVSAAPTLKPTPYVPGATSLIDHCGDSQAISPALLLPILLTRLWKNYEIIIAGKYRQLLDIYRRRSIIIGRDVKIMSDPHETDQPEKTIAEGIVSRIGDNLELYLEGRTEPIIQGRLILGK